jgi:DNA polymerase III subunit delta'
VTPSFVPTALDRHPAARAVLGPAMAGDAAPSHAYLFHGPGGAGKRTAAREFAALLLSDGSADPERARARVLSGAHPDLTWVTPSGAHELLVSDIDEPVVAAASRTPFESSRRVFVIERVDELGDEAANRMLKTLEEPASFVHLILITDRIADVLPTIRSRCLQVRFEPASVDAVAAEIAAGGVSPDTALACARLALGDAERARELASEPGRQLRLAGEHFARSPLVGSADGPPPWEGLLSAARVRGDAVSDELEQAQAADLELYPRRERKRAESVWTDRIRRTRRRAETATLDLGLQVASLWYADLLAGAHGADDLVRNVDRRDALSADAGPAAGTLVRAIELVEDTRVRFVLNVGEELACEALAYRLQDMFTG